LVSPTRPKLGKVAKLAFETLRADKAYIPLDDLYVFQSTLGDMPSNMDDLFDAEDAKLLREATELGLDYTNPDHVKQILFSSVSLAVLTDFARKVDDEKLTTFNVVENFIKPTTKSRQCPYAELLEPEQVGRPHYFVTQSWGGNFMDMVERIKNELGSENPDNVFLWLDFFALNLHIKDRTAFTRVQDALMISKRGTLAIMEPGALVASCCLYELWVTVNKRGLRFLKIVDGNTASPDDWDEAVLELDMFSCKSSKQRDRGIIFKAVNDGPGVEKLNEQLQVLLTLCPPHFHNADLAINGPWTEHVRLETLEDWIQSPKRVGKTMWVRGPNGTGKSTVYAAILDRWGLSKDAIPVAVSDKKKDSMAVLAHAVCYNDTKTRIPMRIVHSLAWQLCAAFPDELGNYYAGLGPLAVKQLDDITEAVKVLLKNPIKNLLQDKPVLLALDGLDEGTGDICSLTTAGMSNYDDQMLTDINLCWENPVLRFVCIHLRTLPKNVSLVVTSRSNTLTNGEQDYLEHMLDSFGSHGLTVELVEDFFANDGKSLDLSNSGPMRHLSQKMRSSIKSNSSLMSAYSIKGINPWNLTFPRMVYARVAKELEAKSQEVPPAVQDAIKSYLELQAKTTLSTNGVQRLVRLLEVLAAIRDPPTLAQLRTWGFKDVKRLTAACGFMLHVSATGEVHAFHKIFFKFLADRRQAGEFFASPRSGHKSLARMLTHNIMNPNGVITQYALRNVLLHAHLADDHEGIDKVAGSVDFWEKSFKAGVGLFVYQDLLRFGRMTDTVKDSVQFLSQHHSEFIVRPNLVSQRAYDTPKHSLFARKLRKAGVKVPGRVLSKPDLWSAEQFRIFNPEGVVWALALSPDGMILALGTGDHRVILNEARSGIRLAYLDGHTDAVMGVAYSSDGHKIASASCDGTVRLWDAGGGVRIATLRGHEGAVTCCCFSPSGRYVVSGGIDSTVRIWDVEDSDKSQQVAVLTGHTRWVADVRYGAYGNVIVSGANDGAVNVWDAATWELRFKLFQAPTAVYSVALNHDETSVAAGCGDGTVPVWSLISMKQTADLAIHRDRVESVEFSYDGTSIVSSSRDARICVSDASNGTVYMKLDGHRGAVHCARFSPDNSRLYTGSADKTARVWSVVLGKGMHRTIHERREQHFGSVQALAFGPTNSIIATGSEDCLVKVWDAEKEKLTCICEGHLGPVFCVAVSPDGSTVVSGSHDSTVRVWDAKTGRERGMFEGHEQIGRIHDLKFSPDGYMVASASYDMTVALWDPNTGVERGRLVGHAGSVTCVGFSGDGKLAVTGSNDRTLKVWDLGTLKEVAGEKEHEGHVTCLAVSPCGKLFASGSNLGLVQIWSFDGCTKGKTIRPASEEKQRTEKQEGTAHMVFDMDEVVQTLSVCFSRDGRLVAAGLEDQLVRVWEISSGKEVAQFVGHLAVVQTLEFSPDGRLLASGSDDMTVRLWDIGHL